MYENTRDNEYRPSAERFASIHAYIKALANEQIALPNDSVFVSWRFHGFNELGETTHVMCYEYIDADGVYTYVDITYWEESDMLHFGESKEKPAVRIFLDKGAHVPLPVIINGLRVTFAPQGSIFHIPDDLQPEAKSVSSSIGVWGMHLAGLANGTYPFEPNHDEQLQGAVQKAIADALGVEDFAICDGFNDANRQVQAEHRRHLQAELTFMLSELSQATGLQSLSDWARTNPQPILQAAQVENSDAE